MSEEIRELVLESLTPKHEYGRNARSSGWIKWDLERDGRRVPIGQIEKALKALLESGEVVALKGHEITWHFHDKRAATTYYMTPDYRDAKLKEVAEAVDDRRRQRAADLADIAMRQRYPKEWDALKDQFYKELVEKEYRG